MPIASLSVCEGPAESPFGPAVSSEEPDGEFGDDEDVWGPEAPVEEVLVLLEPREPVVVGVLVAVLEYCVDPLESGGVYESVGKVVHTGIGAVD